MTRNKKVRITILKTNKKVRKSNDCTIYFKGNNLEYFMESNFAFDAFVKKKADKVPFCHIVFYILGN